MVQLTRQSVDRVIIQGNRFSQVQTKPRETVVRVVQTVSPVPVGTGEVADPGDLTLIFNNKLI